MTSRASMRNSLAKKSTSLGLKPWMWIGWLRLMYRSRSRYHSNGMYGLCPPCMRIWTAPSCLGLVDLGADLLVRERPAFVVLRPAVERAEAAVGDADVRVVDVAVDDVRDDVVRMLLAGARDPLRRRARGAARSCRSREGRAWSWLRRREETRAIRSGTRPARDEPAEELGQPGEVLRRKADSRVPTDTRDTCLARRRSPRAPARRARRDARGPSRATRSGCACTPSASATGVVRCATHTAKTNGSPVQSFHSAPRS